VTWRRWRWSRRRNYRAHRLAPCFPVPHRSWCLGAARRARRRGRRIVCQTSQQAAMTWRRSPMIARMTIRDCERYGWQFNQLRLSLTE